VSHPEYPSSGTPEPHGGRPAPDEPTVVHQGGAPVPPPQSAPPSSAPPASGQPFPTAYPATPATGPGADATQVVGPTGSADATQVVSEGYRPGAPADATQVVSQPQHPQHPYQATMPPASTPPASTPPASTPPGSGGPYPGAAPAAPLPPQPAAPTGYPAPQPPQPGQPYGTQQIPVQPTGPSQPYPTQPLQQAQIPAQTQAFGQTSYGYDAPASGTPASVPPTGYTPGYGQQPAPAPRKRSVGTIVMAAVSVVLLLVAIGMTVLYVNKNSDLKSTKASNAKTVSTDNSQISSLQKQLQTEKDNAASAKQTSDGQINDLKSKNKLMQDCVDDVNTWLATKSQSAFNKALDTLIKSCQVAQASE
jgi:hypothetical protein